MLRVVLLGQLGHCTARERKSKAEAKGVAKVAPEGEPTKKEYTAKETKQFAEENEAAKALGFETGANEALGSINRAIREGRFEGSKEKFDTYAEIPKQELERYAAERKVQKSQGGTDGLIIFQNGVKAVK